MRRLKTKRPEEKNMKKTILTIIAIMLLTVSAAYAATEDIAQGSSLDAALLSYKPVPAQPGDLLTVYIQISNEGSNPSAGGTIKILDSYPFTVETTDAQKDFPSIPAQGTFLITAQVRIDKNANEGINYLTVRVFPTSSSSYIERSLPMTIQGRSGALSVTSVASSPATIAPGEEANLTLSVKNIGDTRLRNVDANIDLTGIDLAPTTSSNSRTIGSLAGGQSTTFTFNIIALPGATPNAYQVPVTLSYEDEQGNSVSQEKMIGAVVGSEPELLVYFDQIGVTKKTKQGKVVIKFVNKGLTQIKLLEMEILENKDVRVTSESPILYIGNIDIDDYESTDISLKVAKDTVTVPIKVTYRDALNRQYEQTYDLKLDAKSAASGGGLGWVGWLVIIVIIIGAVWLWRRRKAKKGLK